MQPLYQCFVWGMRAACLTTELIYVFFAATLPPMHRIYAQHCNIVHFYSRSRQLLLTPASVKQLVKSPFLRDVGTVSGRLLRLQVAKTIALGGVSTLTLSETKNRQRIATRKQRMRWKACAASTAAHASRAKVGGFLLPASRLRDTLATSPQSRPHKRTHLRLIVPSRAETFAHHGNIKYPRMSKAQWCIGQQRGPANKVDAQTFSCNPCQGE